MEEPRQPSSHQEDMAVARGAMSTHFFSSTQNCTCKDFEIEYDYGELAWEKTLQGSDF
jgi:hypothetical protein